MYYCQEGKTVTIIEPNNELRQQTLEKLGTIDFELKVQTIN